jgi:hypothetical protein
MKFAAALACLVSAQSATQQTLAFSPYTSSSRLPLSALPMSASTTEPAVERASDQAQQDPLLIRAARGEKVERTPVWMMRQAGRHIKEYRDLCKTHKTFRERSEIPDVAVEVSLQPWRNYQTDGCILFSDILTPFPGMGVDFTIDEKLGPICEPIRSYEDAKKVGYSCAALQRVGALTCRSNAPLSIPLHTHTHTHTDSQNRPHGIHALCGGSFEDASSGGGS